MKAVLAKLSLLTVARLIGAVAMFLTTVLITRHFGVDAIATYATAMAAASLVSVLILFGFHAFAPVLAAEYETKRHFALLRGLVWTGLRNLALATCLIACVGGLVWVFRPDALTEPWLTAIWFTVFAVPALAMMMFSGGILTGLQRQAEAQLPDSLFRPLVLLGFTACLALFFPSAGVEWIVALAAASFWIAAVGQAVPFTRALAQRPAGQADYERDRWRRMSPSWLTISLVWDYAIDVYLLVAAFIAGAPEIAILHICFRYRVLAGFGMRSIYSLCQPKIYAAVAAGDAKAVRQSLSLTNMLALAYGALTFAALWMFAPFLLGLFGPALIEGSAMLVIVSATFVVRALFGPALAVLGIHKHHAVVARVLALSLALAVAASIPLYSALGIEGIAWAYTGGNTLSAICLWWIAKSRTGIDCAVWASDVSLLRSWRSA